MKKIIYSLLAITLLACGNVNGDKDVTKSAPDLETSVVQKTDNATTNTMVDESIPYDVINKALAELSPELKADSIRMSAMPGMFEISMGMQVLYMSRDGHYFFEGDLYDIRQKINLTEEQRKLGRLAIINKIPEADMIVYAPQKTEYTVTIFTDIDCPYCRRMHEQMAKYNDLGFKIRYLAYPRTGKGTPSYFKAVSVWCAEDKAQAMTIAKTGGVLESKTCEHPVDQQLALASDLAISGTPTFILEDGSILPGYVPPERLMQVIMQRRDLKGGATLQDDPTLQADDAVEDGVDAANEGILDEPAESL